MSEPDVTMLAPLDRALVELAVADRDNDHAAGSAAIMAVVSAWISYDAREQACWLRYHRSNTKMGAALRASLDTAVAAGYDVGAMQADYDEMRGRPWP